MYRDDKEREYTILKGNGAKPYRAVFRKNAADSWKVIPVIPLSDDLEDIATALRRYAKRYHLKECQGG